MSHSRHFAWLAILAFVAVIPARAKDLAVVVNKARRFKLMADR